MANPGMLYYPEAIAGMVRELEQMAAGLKQFNLNGTQGTNARG
jgi:hypothetical protein